MTVEPLAAGAPAFLAGEQAASSAASATTIGRMDFMDGAPPGSAAREGRALAGRRQYGPAAWTGRTSTGAEKTGAEMTGAEK